MALKFLKTEPIRFDKLHTQNNCTPCSDNYLTCLKVQDGDPIRLKLEQTPLTEYPINDDPHFLDYTGDLLLGNGTFTGGTTGWTLGAGWVYGTNEVDHTTGNATSISTTFNSIGSYCRIKFKLKNVGSNGFLTVTVGTTSKVVTGEGDFDLTFYTEPQGVFTLDFAASGTWSGTLDDVFVYGFGSSYTVFVSDNWQLTDTGIQHIPDGVSANHYMFISTKYNGVKYYQLKIKISGMSAGVFQMYGVNIDRDGEWIVYSQMGLNQGPYANDPALLNYYQFLATNDFDGTIEYIEIREMNYNHVIHLLNLDGSYVADMTPKIQYINEFIVINETTLVNDNGNPVAEGCYKFALCDPDYGGNEFGEEYLYDQTVTGSDWQGSPMPAWTIPIPALGFGGHYNNSITNIGIIEIPVSVAHPIQDGKYYTFQFKYYTTRPAANATISGEFKVGDGTGIKSLLVEVLLDDQIANISSGANNYAFFDFAFHSQNIDATIESDIYYVSLRLGSRSFRQYTYFSNCIDYKTNHACTVLLTGKFTTGNINSIPFDTSVRVSASIITPKYNGKEETVVAYRGKRQRTFKNYEKLFRVVIEAVDEYTHDAIAAIVSADAIEILNPNISAVYGLQFYCPDKEYEPNWSEKGDSPIAEAEFNVVELEQYFRKNNCG